jgi:phosphatidylserine decarboxylase proenzyme
MDKLTYWQRAKVVFQYIMPQLYLTQFAGWFAQQKWVQ